MIMRVTIKSYYSLSTYADAPLKLQSHSSPIEALEEQKKTATAASRMAGSQQQPGRKTLAGALKNNRHKMRLVTLNVLSPDDKRTAIAQNLKGNMIHVAVVTETHIRQERTGGLHFDRYAPVRTCCRKTVKTQGRAVILAHTTVPSATEYSLVVQTPIEKEYCAAMVHPNHTEDDQLLIVGIYRRPERGRPPYQNALDRTLKKLKEPHATTLLMGDHNKNDLGARGKGAL